MKIKKQIKKLPNKEGNIRRIPRASGLTMMVKNYNQQEEGNNKQRTLEQIKDHVINQYIKEGFRINGKTMELSEMASYLGITLKVLIKKINRYGDILGGKDGEAFSRAVKLFSFNGVMATRSLVLGQAQNLLRSQSDGYVPFVTSEVNRALTNLIATDNTMLALLKAISPEPQRQPNVVINNQQATMNTAGNTEQLMNINQAVKLIDHQRELGLLEDPEAQNRLLAQHVTEEVPQVIATEQRGYSAPDQVMVPQKKRKVPHHDERNEQEAEIL